MLGGIMNDRPTRQPTWQYAIVWTPGSPRSSAQLWATTKQGTRTLWDAWEAPEFTATPTLSTVLYWLYCLSVEAQERHAHLG
jgi:hypothetical protein